MNIRDLPAPQQAIAAILRLSKELDLRVIGKTALVKFVYLLDVVTAEQRTDKTTFTGLNWYLHHFGPYDAALEQHIQALDKKAYHKVRIETPTRELDWYEVYASFPAPSLQDLGLDFESRERLTRWTKTYLRDLPGLLHFVYTETAPMEGARAGEALTFENALRPNFKTDIRPIPIPVPDPKTLQKARDLLKAIGARHAKLVAAGSGIAQAAYDHVYRAEMPREDDGPVEGQCIVNLKNV